MAIRIVGGSILLVGGAIVTNDNCCCDLCGCTFDPTRELYLTIDNFALDGGETCDAGCAGLAVTAKVNAFGAQGSPYTVNFFSANCAEDEPYNISVYTDCDETYGMTVEGVSGGRMWIVDNCMDNNKLCIIAFQPSIDASEKQVLGNPTCDPFYIQATVDVDVYDADGTTQCGTGTLRITITE